MSFNLPIINTISFSAIGLIICLISLPFLMVEWLTLPLGTHSKRIKLYQGAGNLFALAILTGGWIWREESFLYINSHINELASITFSSGGLLLTVLFGWLGGQIAGFISRKKISAENLNFLKPRNVMTKSNQENIELGQISVQELIGSVSATPARQN